MSNFTDLTFGVNEVYLWCYPEYWCNADFWCHRIPKSWIDRDKTNSSFSDVKSNNLNTFTDRIGPTSNFRKEKDGVTTIFTNQEGI